MSATNEVKTEINLSKSQHSPIENVNNSKSSVSVSLTKTDEKYESSNYVKGQWYPGNTNKNKNDVGYSWHHHTPEGRKVLSEMSDSFYMD